MLIIERSEVNKQASEHLNADQFDEIGRLPGIEIHQINDPSWSDDIKCAEYLFGIMLKEKWAQGKIPREFWNNGRLFLHEQGYQSVEEPSQGDIVAYAIEDLGEKPWISLGPYLKAVERRSPPYFEHFGILREDGRVTSKFGTGYVYVHNIDTLPEHFGSNIYFFRREPEPNPHS